MWPDLESSKSLSCWEPAFLPAPGLSPQQLLLEASSPRRRMEAPHPQAGATPLLCPMAGPTQTPMHLKGRPGLPREREAKALRSLNTSMGSSLFPCLPPLDTKEAPGPLSATSAQGDPWSKHHPSQEHNLRGAVAMESQAVCRVWSMYLWPVCGLCVVCGVWCVRVCNVCGGGVCV